MAATRKAGAQDKIVCPKCGFSFHLKETLVEQLRKRWESQTRAALERDLRASLEAAAERKAKQRAQADLKARDDQLRQQAREMTRLRATVAKEAEDRAKQLSRGLRTQLEEQEERLTDQTRVISRLQGEIRKLSAKMPAERAQELGEARELVLEERLRKRFPADSVSAVPRGQRGADIVQTVCVGGRQLGSILWEAKRAKGWSATWLPKLHEERDSGRHAVAVLVADARPPKTEDPPVEKDGIWIVPLELAVPLAVVLRDGIIRSAEARSTPARRDDAKGRVFDYLRGADFTRHVRRVLEAARDMQASLDAEKRAAQAQWTKRASLIETVVADTVQVCLDLGGCGAPLRRVEALSLPAVKALAPPDA